MPIFLLRLLFMEIAAENLMERRKAEDGQFHTEKEFDAWYGGSAWRKWMEAGAA